MLTSNWLCSGRTRGYGVTLALMLLILSSGRRARGVILLDSGDPAHNTTAPTGALLDSGWQYQGDLGDFSGTPIQENYFITARHFGGVTGTPFTLGGAAYTTIRKQNSPNADLTIWQIGGAFPPDRIAPLYTDDNEVGKTAVLFGRGTQRGEEVRDGQNELKGWRWGPRDHVRRWGQNEIHSIKTIKGEEFLTARFNAGNPVDHEAMLSTGDSGGAVFLQDAGVWKLAGIHTAVEGPFNDTDTGDGFNAAIFDKGDLYTKPNETWVLTRDRAFDVPAFFHSARISASLDWINGIIDVDRTTLTSAGDGDFRTAATWHPGTLQPGLDTPVVMAGHTVNVDGDAAAYSLSIESAGAALHVGGDDSLTTVHRVQLAAGTLDVAPGGLLSAGGDFDWTGPAEYVSQLGASTTGRVAAAGDIHLGGTLTLQVTSVGLPGLSSHTILSAAGVNGIVGTFDNVPTVHVPASGPTGHLGFGVFHRGLEYVENVPGRVAEVAARQYVAGPGDGNGDGNVDGQDIQNLIVSFSLPGQPRDRVWPQNDTAGGPLGRGDGNVDGQDITDLITHFTGDSGPPADGSAEATYNPATGEFAVSVDAVMSWSLVGPGVFTGEALGSVPETLGGHPGTLISANVNTIGEGGFGTRLSYEDARLGQVSAVGTPPGEFALEYVLGFGRPKQIGRIVVVPEPGVWMLLGVGMCCWFALRRRPRRAGLPYCVAVNV